MKNLLFIPFLFMCSMVIGQSTKIIGTPIKLEKLEVAQNDFPKVMTWSDAKSACAILGKGWRLPTKDELNLMYLNKDKIGGFADAGYWSSTEGATKEWEQVLYQYFKNGTYYYTWRENNYSARAVRTIN